MYRLALLVGLLVCLGAVPLAAYEPLSVTPAHISTDPTILYDYDIVYTRSPRFIGTPSPSGVRPEAHWAEFGHPVQTNPGTDLMLLHPDGSEELLVAGEAGAIQDPYVSLDGQSVYFTRFHQASDEPNAKGSDIYRVDLALPGRPITRLTTQTWATNRGLNPAGVGVYNMHPCPLPNGRIAFVSNRRAYLPPPKSYPTFAWQLHTMDADGSNVETVGWLNLGSALHPTLLTTGDLMFSSLENQGERNNILWGLWKIWPDGRVWAPIISAFTGFSAPPGFHFQTQLSSGDIVAELYYNQNQDGFGTLFRLPLDGLEGHATFGNGDIKSAPNTGWDFLNGRKGAMPFTPWGMTPLTLFTGGGEDRPAICATQGTTGADCVPVGKVTHPSSAPDNHLLVVWSGPATIGGSSGTVKLLVPKDSGIYLLKNGETIREPGQLLHVKNDPNYNEQWPRAVVPYRRIYGVDAPPDLTKIPNEASPHLPEGTPWGLIGTSSLSKRESAPQGIVPPDGVTAASNIPETQTAALFVGGGWNWSGQGADSGRYTNEDIWGIRIVATEPSPWQPRTAGQFTCLDRISYPAFCNRPAERLRILGEIPVHEGKPEGLLDPDGNPDTSFLAKIPGDVPFTFQAIDKDGHVLNMAQTWHQVRPGEARHNCGGCHAHSQAPTLFEKTFAASPEYQVKTLNTSRIIEYVRDIKPIIETKCVSCHSRAQMPNPWDLIFDDPTPIAGMPNAYYRLARDSFARYSGAKFVGFKSDNNTWILRGNGFAMQSAFIWPLQSRRSPLLWRLANRRLDGFDNDFVSPDRPTHPKPGLWALDDPRRASLAIDSQALPKGTPLDPAWPLYNGNLQWVPGTVDHTTVVTEAEVRAFVEWVGTGTTIDMQAITPPLPGITRSGIEDDTLPTLTVMWPQAGANGVWTRIILGMVDTDSGLKMDTWKITASIPIDGITAGANLASQFEALDGDRWQWVFSKPMGKVEKAVLTVEVADLAGNRQQIIRTFSTEAPPPPPITHLVWQGTVAPETTAVCQVDGLGAVVGAQRLQCALTP